MKFRLLFPKIRARFLACAALALAAQTVGAAAQTALRLVEQAIASQYAIDHLAVEKLAARLNSQDSLSLALFDVREPEEYAVSHIRGARLLPPSTKPEDFMRLHGDFCKGKNVVLYCSVGKRSSELALALKPTLERCGALSAHNLRGGIFRWYNSGFPVVNSRGASDEVHPFDWFWGGLVQKRARENNAERQR